MTRPQRPRLEISATYSIAGEVHDERRSVSIYGSDGEYMTIPYHELARVAKFIDRADKYLRATKSKPGGRAR